MKSAGGVVGDVDMEEFPTVVAKDQEAEEQAEGASKKVRHVEDGRGEGRRMYLATVSSATS
jgi:hypothetical protein